MRRARIAGYSALAVASLLACAVIALYLTLRASVPQVDGEVRTPSLAASVSIERDALGTPTLRAQSRSDLAFATGFVHGQDRFFQMDLMRRAAAGELAQLFGAGIVETDKKLRRHGFKRLAQRIVDDAPAVDRQLLVAYAAGVNLALQSAGARAWEYVVLRSEPAPWRVEDSLLAAFSMYLNLNDTSGERELARAQLRQALPPALFDFLHPPGTEWDAPLVGGKWQAAPLPGPEVFDLRSSAARAAALAALPSPHMVEEPAFVGSNSWAVAGSHAADNAALFANDMHLDLQLPHVWYRARLIVEAAGETARDLVGVTLPGLPLLIAGSNGRIAWGYTNSYGDWTDLVVVEVDPEDPARYLTAGGPEPFEIRQEAIEVRGAEPATFTTKATRWGPVIGQDAAGRPLALAWTAHRPHATNLRALDFEAAATVEEALQMANRAGGPVQNFVVADADGHIGWTLMGQVPVRSNYDSTVPSSWRTAGTGWTGWRAPQEYPRIVDPASGRLWTANARTIDAAAWLAFAGDGGYDLGARAAQIRDGLLALQRPGIAEMAAIQLDDRALFLMRWRDLLLDALGGAAVASDPRRAEARKLMQQWSGRAGADDVGYRIVRAARLQFRNDIFESLVVLARARFPGAKFAASAQFEGPLWQLVTQRPQHLLDPHYDSWDAALLASFDRALATLREHCDDMQSCTWGSENTLQMRHPLSARLPLAHRWLDMPAVAMPGDVQMPRVQGKTFGASQRLVVSPGREAQGSLQMPGGPVDHPLSPFYGAGHEAWVRGERTPLLPGKAQHVLRLRPAPASEADSG